MSDTISSAAAMDDPAEFGAAFEAYIAELLKLRTAVTKSGVFDGDQLSVEEWAVLRALKQGQAEAGSLAPRELSRTTGLSARKLKKTFEDLGAKGLVSVGSGEAAAAPPVLHPNGEAALLNTSEKLLKIGGLTKGATTRVVERALKFNDRVGKAIDRERRTTKRSKGTPAGSQDD